MITSRGKKRDHEIAQRNARTIKLKRPFACRHSLPSLLRVLAITCVRIPRACENRFRVISIIPLSGKKPMPTGFSREPAKKADTCSDGFTDTVSPPLLRAISWKHKSASSPDRLSESWSQTRKNVLKQLKYIYFFFLNL